MLKESTFDVLASWETIVYSTNEAHQSDFGQNYNEIIIEIEGLVIKSLKTYVLDGSEVLLVGSVCPFSFLEGDFGFSLGKLISSIFLAKSDKI